MNLTIGLIISLVAVNGITSIMHCSETHQADPTYHLIKPCHLSEMVILGRGYQKTVKKCAEFALQKHGLAFNFMVSRGGGNHGNRTVKQENGGDPDNDYNEPCLVFDCAESENFTSLANDTRYDYYSLFANPLPTSNYTCVPGVGMFKLFMEHLNYTSAMSTCQEEGGDLAFVLTDQRTSGLSALIAKEMNRIPKTQKMAYVGLNDMDSEGVFETVLGEPLNCFPYRAWAPGHPRSRKNSEDCVVIDTERMWKVVSCERKMPFICELYPGGPADFYDDDDYESCPRV